MDKIYRILKSEYFLLFILAVINFFIAFYVIKLSLWHSDSETYLNAARFLQGEKLDAIPFNRLLSTPLMLYASIGMSWFTGNFYSGMMAVNLIFYFLIIYVFFKLSLVIYNDRRVALFSAVLFLADYCFFSFGPSYLADLGGWFFFVLGSWLAVKYYREKNKKFYYLAIAAAGVGVLFKEYGALGLISLSLLIINMPYSWRKKFKEIVTAGFLFALIPVIYYLIFYIKFHYSYFDWYGLNISAHGQSYGLILILKDLIWLFSAGWPIFLYGIWQEKKYFERDKFKILTALLPASLAFLAWPALTERIAFIFVVWLALIAGFGLSKVKNNYLAAAVVIFYIIINYLVAFHLS